MRKLIVIVSILIILAGTVFYFGWIQIQLTENTYAVIFTKTGGWDETVTEPGKFVWRWERLLPTNLSMHKFTLTPHTARVSASGSLPSGEIYSGILDPSPDFDFEIDIIVSFNIDPESLPDLVADAALTEETFDAWHAKTENEVSAKAATFIRERSTDVDAASTLTAMGDALAEDLTRYLQSAFPHVEFSAITIRDIEIPDFELYLTAKELFLEYSESRKESYEEALSQITWTQARAEQYFDVLKKYGELISEYPALLDLLSLKNGDMGSILEEIDAYSPAREQP